MKTGAKLGILALVVAIGCLVLWIIEIRQVDIPENRIGFVVGFLAAVALGVAAFFKGPGWIGGAAATLAIVIGGFFNFTVAISEQELAAGAIQVGDSLPPFTALTDKGERFDSATLIGNPTLIKFFRGHW